MNFHMLMGIFYVLGLIQGLMVHSLIRELHMTRIYVFGMTFIGIAVWFYQAFLFRIFNKVLEYQMTSVVDKQFGITEVFMKPITRGFAFLAGRFVFVTFPNLGKRAQHQFTISRGPDSDELHLAIRGLGDYTDMLNTKISVSDAALVEGPYGHFSSIYMKECDQIRIDGSVGITRFPSLARNVFTNSIFWWVNNVEEPVCGIFLQRNQAFILDFGHRSKRGTYQSMR